ncbi:hypothetical protein VPH35_099246 [Triticum aestivum]
MSWLPPHSPHDRGDPPPKSDVLDTLVYADDRTNASTAEGFTSNGHAICLTFWPAHPPLISYFTVHLPTLLQDRSATSLTLLPRLLEVLPTHPTRLFADWSVALLSCPGDGRFLVANLRSTYDLGQYALDLFDSGSGTWSTRSMHTEPPHEDFYPTDLWNGILIGDLLRNDDVLRFIHLPVLVVPNKMTPGRLSCDRDVSVGRDGSIKYSEVWAHPVPGSPNRATYISEDWGAAILTWLEPKKKWHIDLKLKASDIIVDETHSQLLPQHDVKATTKNATLSRLHTGHPALSLHDDDVVYIMAKVDHMDDDSWMLAVDMRNKTLKGVAALTSKRSWGFRFMYLQSDLSNHLMPTSENTEVFNLPPKERSVTLLKLASKKLGRLLLTAVVWMLMRLGGSRNICCKLRNKKNRS